jgi:molecular chaperone DnaK
VESTLTAFDQALADADLSADDLDRILFVGGSKRIPLVWEMVARHTGIQPLVAISRDEAVALGAGVQAVIIAGEPLDTILVDIAPHVLGIEVVEFIFDEIIPDRYSVILPRNTSLPASRSRIFSALTPDQPAIEVKIYQGEAPIAAQNSLLGQFLFKDLRSDAPGEPPHVTVGLDLDLNGILKISATDRGSRQVKHLSAKFFSGL